MKERYNYCMNVISTFLEPVIDQEIGSYRKRILKKENNK